jgi:sugar lactone lactonase YvrE
MTEQPEEQGTAPIADEGVPASPPTDETPAVAAAVAAAPGAAAGAAAAAPAGSEESGHRRRVALLLFLSAVALSLAVFAAWYLLFHKPFSEFPLPNLTAPAMPGYSYSLYGVARPTGIAVTSDGSRIYATQTEGAAEVVVYDDHGNQLESLLPPDTGTDHVFVYVAIDPLTGNVYVSDRPTASIDIYSPDGTFLRTFDAPTALNGWQPLGLSFDDAGNLLVTDVANGMVDEFGPDGSLLRSIGAANQFNFPNDALSDTDGRLYVSDSNNGRLVVLDQSGSQVATVRRGPAEGDLGLPRGLALDEQSRLYVVDVTEQAVKVYRAGTADGQPQFLGDFGTQGRGDGAFSFPNAVATDTRGRVYVADWDNDRIQVWSY